MELYIKGQKADLAPGAVFAVTVQSNDITKPDTVQSSYSNTLTLPYTRQNNALLDNAHDPRSIGEAPYQKLEAAVLQDGTEVVPLPKAYLQQSAEGYEVQVFSGAVDFFERLGEKSIQDLDLSRFTHIWDIDAIHDGSGAYRTWQDGYIYVPIDYGKPLDFSNQQASDIYPAVFYRAVLDQLFTEAGVKYEGLDFDHFNDLLLPFCNEKPRHTQGGFSIDSNGWPQIKPGWVYDRTGVSTLMNNAGFYTITGPVTDYGILEITLQVTVEQVPTIDKGMLFAELRRDNKVIDRQELEITVPGIHELKASFRIEPNEDLSRLTWWADKSNFGNPIVLPGSQGAGIISAGHRILTYNEEAFYRTEWALAPNLPDISQKDFFKAVVSLYCLMPTFDPYTNTMKLVQMDRLEENKARALDWSSKLVQIGTAPIPVQYRFGEFAQQNLWRYKEDSFGGSGDGRLVVADAQLEKQKDAVTLPFAASQERGSHLYLPVFERVYRTAEGYDKSVPTKGSLGPWEFLPAGSKVLVERASEDDPDVTVGWGIYRRVDTDARWELIDQQLRYERKNKLQPRLALLKRTGQSGVRLVDREQFRNLLMASCTFQGLDFQTSLLPTYYKSLQGILDRCKGITPHFLLTAQDVQNYDCSIPIWLDQYQSYWYLNSISEFTGEGPTECQLWRL